MRYNRYLKNTALLFAAMTVTKIVGAIFKIPLANILGGTGMAYFSNAYGLYSPIFALTAAGVPTVLMRITAQNLASGRQQNAIKTKKIATLFFGTIGLIGTLIIWCLASFFAENIACSPDSTPAIVAIAPAVFFCCIASVIRGYYEGQSNVLPTAAANVTEAISRALIGLALSYGVIAYAKFTYDNGTSFFGKCYQTYEEVYSAALPVAASAAILAVTLSELCGLLALIIHDKHHNNKIQIPDNIPTDRIRIILSTLIREILPIAVSALVMNCFSFADILTVTRTIENTISMDPEYFKRSFAEVISSGIQLSGLANFMYGSYTGIAMSLFMLVPSFAGMSEKTAIPDIAAAWEKKDHKALTERASFLLKTSAVIGYPACFGAAAMAEPILSMLYRSRSAEIGVCLNSFIVLCLGGMFMVTASALSGIFQAIGKAYIPLWLMCGAVAIKITINPILIGIRELNISGAAISTVISYTITAFTILLILKKYIPTLKLLSVIWRPMLSGILCAAAARIAYMIISLYIPHNIATILSIACGGVIYGLSLIFTGCFRTSHIIKQQKKKIFEKRLAKKQKIG